MFPAGSPAPRTVPGTRQVLSKPADGEPAPLTGRLGGQVVCPVQQARPRLCARPRAQPAGKSQRCERVFPHSPCRILRLEEQECSRLEQARFISSAVHCFFCLYGSCLWSFSSTLTKFCDCHWCPVPEHSRPIGIKQPLLHPSPQPLANHHSLSVSVDLAILEIAC